MPNALDLTVKVLKNLIDSSIRSLTPKSELIKQELQKGFDKVWYNCCLCNNQNEAPVLKAFSKTTEGVRFLFICQLE